MSAVTFGYGGIGITVNRHRYKMFAGMEYSRRRDKLYDQLGPYARPFKGSLADQDVLICSSPDDCDGNSYKHYLMHVGQYFIELAYRGGDDVSEDEFLAIVGALENHLDDVLPER